MKTLRLGHTDPAVRYLTQQLNKALYITPVTDVFDQTVHNKVLKFQTHRGLIADGIVGPATWRALRLSTPWLRYESELQCIPLAYPNKTFKYRDTTTPTGAEYQVLNSYNNYAQAVDKISDLLMIDSATAHAVVAVESAGSGMELGRMVIRFENHIFWRKWGKYNQAAFSRWYSFNKDQPWKSHTFDNRMLHTGDQDREWMAFQHALRYSEDAACESISMGLGQLMGFHWEDLGYESASRMVEDQAAGERNQLLTFFDFIAKDPEMLTALQEQDWWTFAYKYNGSGQPELYSKWLSERYAMTKRIV